MTHDLLHGDLGAAVVDNVFLLVGLPLLAVWVFWNRRRGTNSLSRPAIIVIVVGILVWTVTRNLPGFPLVPTALNR